MAVQRKSNRGPAQWPLPFIWAKKPEAAAPQQGSFKFLQLQQPNKTMSEMFTVDFVSKASISLTTHTASKDERKMLAIETLLPSVIVITRLLLLCCRSLLLQRQLYYYGCFT
jgi:hypothetical protein